MCGLCLLLVLVPVARVFLRVPRFSFLHKNQNFQIPIRSGNGGKNNHSVDEPLIKFPFLFIFFYIFFLTVPFIML